MKVSESGARVGWYHRPAQCRLGKHQHQRQGCSSQPGHSALGAKVSLREPQKLRQEAAALEASSGAIEVDKAKQARCWAGQREAVWGYLC